MRCLVSQHLSTDHLLAFKLPISCRLRLNWPEGAAHRKSVSAVQKLASLRKLLQDLGDHSVSCTSHMSPRSSQKQCMLRYLDSKRTLKWRLAGVEGSAEVLAHKQ